MPGDARTLHTLRKEMLKLPHLAGADDDEVGGRGAGVRREPGLERLKPGQQHAALAQPPAAANPRRSRPPCRSPARMPPPSHSFSSKI